MWYYSWHTISTTEVQQNWSFLDLPVSALTAPLVLQQLQLQPAGSTDPAYLHSSQPTSEKFQRQRKLHEVHHHSLCTQFRSLIKKHSIQIQFVWTEEVRSLKVHLPPNLWVCSMCVASHMTAILQASGNNTWEHHHHSFKCYSKNNL